MNMIKSLVDSWRGASSLYRAFWLQAVPINLAFFFSGVLVGYLAGDFPQLSKLVLLVGPLYLLFSLWLCVALWRCAPNTNHRLWFYVARIFASLIAAGMVSTLFRLAL